MGEPLSSPAEITQRDTGLCIPGRHQTQEGQEPFWLLPFLLDGYLVPGPGYGDVGAQCHRLGKDEKAVGRSILSLAVGVGLDGEHRENNEEENVDEKHDIPCLSAYSVACVSLMI